MQTSHGKYVKRQLYGWDWCGDYYDGGLRRINSRRWLLKRDHTRRLHSTVSAVYIKAVIVPVDLKGALRGVRMKTQAV